MEDYKKTVKRRILALLVFAIAVGAFEMLQNVWPIYLLRDNPMFGFQLGFLVSIEVIAVLQIIRYKRLLRDEKALRLQYNKEHDERRRAIRTKAGAPFLVATSIAMILAADIAGYFNIVCFYTLMAAAVCQVLLALILKVIVSHKM